MNVDVTWLKKFEQENGRPLRVLHVGNIANNAYINAKYQRKVGIEADVICGDAYHIMGCPEWEEAYITEYGNDDNYPIFKDLKGYKRPDWFVQGPFISCCDFLRAKHKGQTFRAAIIKKLMLKTSRSYRFYYIYVFLCLVITLRFRILLNIILRIFFHKCLKFLEKRKSIFHLYLKEIIINIGTILSKFRIFRMPYEKEINFSLLIKDFSLLFQNRKDQLKIQDIIPYASKVILKQIADYYDIIQCYGIEPIWAAISEIKHYVAFEHGTLRSFVFENDALSRLNSLAYRKAQHVFVTNGDCIENTQKLGITNYSGIAHPLEGNWIEDELIKTQIKKEYDTEILIFSPMRHDWNIKGNDIVINALPEVIKRIDKKVMIVFTRWGQEVNRSEYLIDKMGCTNNVKWTPPLCRRKLIEMMQAADIILDQMILPCFGGIVPQALSVGKPVVMSYKPESTEWIFKEPPPVLSAFTAEEIANAVMQCLDLEWKIEYKKKALQWFQDYHHMDKIVEQHLSVYQRVIRQKEIV